MGRGAKVSDLARLAEITATPHPPGPPAAAPNRTGRLVRYTAEVPKDLHRSLKAFALAHDTTTYAVTRALLSLLAEDEDIAERVRSILEREHAR